MAGPLPVKTMQKLSEQPVDNEQMNGCPHALSVFSPSSQSLIVVGMRHSGCPDLSAAKKAQL